MSERGNHQSEVVVEGSGIVPEGMGSISKLRLEWEKAEAIRNNAPIDDIRLFDGLVIPQASASIWFVEAEELCSPKSVGEARQGVVHIQQEIQGIDQWMRVHRSFKSRMNRPERDYYLLIRSELLAKKDYLSAILHYLKQYLNENRHAEDVIGSEMKTVIQAYLLLKELNNADRVKYSVDEWATIDALKQVISTRLKGSGEVEATNS